MKQTIYIRCDKPFTLQRLTAAWEQLVGEAGRLEHVDSAHSQREKTALDRFVELGGLSKSISWRVGPLVAVTGWSAEALSTLAGWRIGTWLSEENRNDAASECFSAPAHLWLRENADQTESALPPAGVIQKVVTGDGITLMLFGQGKRDGKSTVIPTGFEQKKHLDEHIDEGMFLLQVNIDDASAEWLAYTMESLFQAGANDVTMIPMTMKKSRAGIMVQVMCYASQIDVMKHILFRETTTFGVRYFPVACHRLARRFVRVMTEWGEVQVKIGYHLGERVQVAPEYEECAKAARAAGVQLKRVYQQAVELGRASSAERLEEGL
ncbi:nickel insertion protein [Brevibacillus dissolubilis]|uniref:nickel insertion protein n=1 Tax=Brevibacillus dissolubilis TaxID=1844116 RepID=UPI0011171C97|nr:nickel insertion protein [Brevibacillus dissolubilis]